MSKKSILILAAFSLIAAWPVARFLSQPGSTPWADRPATNMDRAEDFAFRFSTAKSIWEGKPYMKKQGSTYSFLEEYAKSQSGLELLIYFDWGSIYKGLDPEKSEVTWSNDYSQIGTPAGKLLDGVLITNAILEAVRISTSVEMPIPGSDRSEVAVIISKPWDPKEWDSIFVLRFADNRQAAAEAGFLSGEPGQPNPDQLFAAAISHFASGRHVEAVELLARCLENDQHQRACLDLSRDALKVLARQKGFKEESLMRLPDLVKGSAVPTEGATQSSVRLWHLGLLRLFRGENKLAAEAFTACLMADRTNFSCKISLELVVGKRFPIGAN